MDGQNQRKRPHRKKLPGSNYSEAFKKEVVADYVNGLDDQRLVASRYGISQSSVAVWAKDYAVLGSETENFAVNCDMGKKKGPAAQGEEPLRQRIKELELALNSEHLKRVGFETMIEIAEKELKIEIRKKSGTKQSKG